MEERNYSAKTVFLLRMSPFTVFRHLIVLSTIVWNFNTFLKDCVTYSFFLRVMRIVAINRKKHLSFVCRGNLES
jgi:hypothetical protein